MGLRLIRAGLMALALGACAGGPPDNPLIGDWHMADPAVSRAPGNLIGFREDCLIVGGNPANVRVARPVVFRDGIDGTLVWFGPPALAEPPSEDMAARVIFLSPNRIQIVWPRGGEAGYLRAVGPDDARGGNADCRTP